MHRKNRLAADKLKHQRFEYAFDDDDYVDDNDDDDDYDDRYCGIGIGTCRPTNTTKYSWQFTFWADTDELNRNRVLHVNRSARMYM